MKSERRWVIAGRAGLYTGQWLLRRDAVRDHIEAIYGVTEKQPRTAGLSEEERALWNKCLRKGDRVLHATITYDDRGFPTWLTSANRSSASEPTP